MTPRDTVTTPEPEGGESVSERELPVRGRRDDPPEWVVDTFGFDPREVGQRYRDWEVRDEQTMDDYHFDLADEFLVVCARDGASNPPDPTVGLHRNYVSSRQGADRTYRYYYFNPLEAADDPT